MMKRAFRLSKGGHPDASLMDDYLGMVEADSALIYALRKKIVAAEFAALAAKATRSSMECVREADAAQTRAEKTYLELALPSADARKPV